MSARTAEYLRLLLTPKDDQGNYVDPSPSIAGLSSGALHLWEVLSNLASIDGEAWPSVDLLARRMHKTAANVRRARAELVAAGVIAVDIGGGADANTYRFPLAAPLSTPRAPARGVDDPHPARQRAATPRGTARPRSIEDPVGINTRQDPARAAAAGAGSPGFGGWPSNRRRGPRNG